MKPLVIGDYSNHAG